MLIASIQSLFQSRHKCVYTVLVLARDKAGCSPSQCAIIQNEYPKQNIQINHKQPLTITLVYPALVEK